MLLKEDECDFELDEVDNRRNTVNTGPYVMDIKQSSKNSLVHNKGFCRGRKGLLTASKQLHQKCVSSFRIPHRQSFFIGKQKRFNKFYI